MILQGHITPIWQPQDYQDITYTLGTKTEMCKRLLLQDPQDHDRYTDQQFQLWYSDANDAMHCFLGDQDFAWLDHRGISLHRAPPGHVVPAHHDQYQAYRQRMDLVDLCSIVRAVVFLEDWWPGHYLGVGDRAFVQWQAGDWVAWFGDMPHSVANLGSRDRYTLTVTGICRL